MKARLSLLIPVALVLAGCAGHWREHRGVQLTAGSAADVLGPYLQRNPIVTVTQGTLSISPEPIVVSRAQGSGAITWRVPEGYAFDGKGIDFTGFLPADVKLDPGTRPRSIAEGSVRCDAPAAAARVVVCRLPAGVAKGRYKYTISVRQLGAQNPIVWDPEVLVID